MNYFNDTSRISLNQVIAMVCNCGLVGSYITIQVDTSAPPGTWGMFIHTEGSYNYHLSTYVNGGYLLQAQVAVTPALMTSGPNGIIGITRDPSDEGVCEIYLPTLDHATLLRSIQHLRNSLLVARQQRGTNHNLN